MTAVKQQSLMVRYSQHDLKVKQQSLMIRQNDEDETQPVPRGEGNFVLGIDWATFKGDGP